MFADGTSAEFRGFPPRGTINSYVDLWHFRHAHLHLRTPDLAFVLSCVDQRAAGRMAPQPGMSPDQRFNNRLDMERGVGCIGHSFGGCTVMRWAQTEPRVRAVFAMDPWMWPMRQQDLDAGLPVPTAVLQAPQFFSDFDSHVDWMRYNRAQVERLADASENRVSVFTVNGARHGDFVDMKLMLGRVAQPKKIMGPVDGMELHAALFDHALVLMRAVLCDDKELWRHTRALHSLAHPMIEPAPRVAPEHLEPPEYRLFGVAAAEAIPDTKKFTW